MTLGSHRAGHTRRPVGHEPQPVEVKTSIDGVPQQVRMKALVEEDAIRPRRSQDDSHLVVGESGEQAARLQELSAPVHQQAINPREAGNDSGPRSP